MAEEIKYPRVIAGVFIFNENNELLLVKQKSWDGKYTNVGGKVEINELTEKAAIREVKEETNLDIYDLKFVGVTDGINLNGKNGKGYEHLIFIDYTALVRDIKKIKINEEIESFIWLKIDEWLKKDESKFAPYMYEVLKKIKNIQTKPFIISDIESKYKRALADYQNLLKQTAREKQEFVKYATEQFLFEILPVYDNLKMALLHADEKNHDNWISGVKHVVKQFKDILYNSGVEEIKTVGEIFDHNIMEAIDKELTQDKNKEGIIARELSAGYKLNGKVIKAARVVVYEYKL